MHDTGCLGPVHWDNPEGGYGEGGGKRVQDVEHTVCPLMDKDKRLMEASCWERLTGGESGSCSEGRGHAQ